MTSKKQARDNDLDLPPGFIEWVDELVEKSLTLSLPELRAYIFKTTGEDFTESYLERTRRNISRAMNRADRFPDPEDRWL
jgi:hypothetical protein